MSDIVKKYLDLLDAQRESAFAALDGLTEFQVWLRPEPKEWCLGEILDHNYLLIASTLPIVRLAWRLQHRTAHRKRSKPYPTEIEDPYHKASFPMWVGFLWKPRSNPRKPTSLEKVMDENRILHAAVRSFYEGKDPDLLGHVHVFDPLFGFINLIVTLRIGIYHDQLHFDDVLKRVAVLKGR